MSFEKPSDELEKIATEGAHEKVGHEIEKAAEVAEIVDFAKDLLRSENQDEQNVGRFYQKIFIPRLERMAESDDPGLKREADGIRAWMENDKKNQEAGRLMNGYSRELLKKHIEEGGERNI